MGLMYEFDQVWFTGHGLMMSRPEHCISIEQCDKLCLKRCFDMQFFSHSNLQLAVYGT